MSYGPSRGSRGGGGRSSHPYSRGGDRRGDYEEEVIEISTNRLYVHNLSWRVSWQDLKDHFRQAGEVIHTKILTEGPGGRSKGCGIVEMDTVDRAANAVEMLNDTELQGRNILIREDREDNGGREGGGARYDDRRGPPARGGGDRDTCNRCGGIGHWARDCTQPDTRDPSERREPRERREKRAPVADNVCAPNGTALETAAPLAAVFVRHCVSSIARAACTRLRGLLARSPPSTFVVRGPLRRRGRCGRRLTARARSRARPRRIRHREDRHPRL